MTKSNVSTYFYKHVLISKIFGVSFTGDESVKYKIYSCVLLFIAIYTYPVIAVIEIFRNDIEEMLDYILYAISGIIGIFKTTAILLNRIKLGKLLFKLEEEPFIPNEIRGGEKERELIDSSVWLINTLSILYWIPAFAIVSTTILISLGKRITTSDPKYWRLEYGRVTMVNTTYSPNFEIFWAYQSIHIVCLTVHFTTVDLIIGAVLGHVSVQFKVLQNNLRRLVYNSYKEMIEDENTNDLSEAEILDQMKPNLIPWKYLRKALKSAVDYHNAIINLANEMELSFTYALLCVFACTLGLVCFTIYRLSMATTPLQFIRAAIEVMCGILQIITICYWGEEIISQSQNVGQAAFESNFVGADPRFQKGLALIIRRSQTPVKLTAGKFANIGLPTFAWIVRSSYSAFMILGSR